jgi:opacity protein-like surface antigen
MILSINNLKSNLGEMLMAKKLVLVTGLLLISLNVFAGNWFVGGNFGWNKTYETPAGDLPMLREEFGGNFVSASNSAEAKKIYAQVLASGGTDGQALEAIKHLISMRIKYKVSWNFDIYGGYKIQNIGFGLSFKYISSPYETINNVDDNRETTYMFWNGAYGTKEGMTIKSLIAFVNYEIMQLNFDKFTPFIECGIGGARTADRLISTTKDVTRNQNVFAYAIKAGLNYKFTENWNANIETVFFGTTKVDATNNYVKNWQFINIGVKYLFN